MPISRMMMMVRYRRMQMQIIQMLVVVATVLAVAVPPAALKAQDGSPQPVIQDVIQRQLDAFRAGDKAAAYAHAAPIIQQRFSYPDIFMQMVVQGYAPLIAPQATQFETFTMAESCVQQLLRLIARDGSAWMAHYTMQQMADGSWRISGCYLEKLPGGAV